ncbi:PREDICTED: methylated RNA-binding protein 1-like isoform X1 [Lupinus angustifolius]|uniref:methylated RNA-binding protein 1-like isoform X1 n=1 Tax=Lupinus angustifolius TaxID=3871 RepID=UPI00092F9A57|nr:PREDICTED: methylated RNA-binding protein 1-like isoform X1 [Lupinus angustifolius]
MMTSHNEIHKSQSVSRVTLPDASCHYKHHNNEVYSKKDGIQYHFTSSSSASLGRSRVSTSVAVQNQTINGSVTAKSVPRPSGLAKPNNFTSIHRNDRSNRTLSNTVADTKRIPNKGPHLHPKFQAATHPSSYHQMGRFSSSANPRQHDFPHTNNYRPNGSVSGANAGHTLTDKFWSRESEMPKELTRGPRCNYNNFVAESSAVKDDIEIPFLLRDQYNLPDFQTEYTTAKFYVIKSFNEDDVHKSIKYGVWTSTPIGNKKLNASFHDAEAASTQTDIKCPIFLFFSVNGSGQFLGVAEMFGPVDFAKDMHFWKLDQYNGFFPIKWHIIRDVPNHLLRHIILDRNENRDVTFTRDTQEIPLKQGVEMLKIFKGYSGKKSLMDDFNFYEKREKEYREKREKELREKKSTKHTRPEHELYGNDNYYKSVRGRDRTETRSSGSKQAATLINLTKNLSLNQKQPYSR